MKTTMRRGTFETNSSSIHTLILVPYDLVERWRELGEEYWIDISLCEKDAEASGNGYGKIDWTYAPAAVEHLTSKSVREAMGEWREPKAYEDDIYANWMLPLDVIENPEQWVNDKYSWIASVEETDDGYVVMVE